MKSGRVISSSASLLLACLGAGGASAQTTEASGDKVEEVVVTGYTLNKPGRQYILGYSRPILGPDS